MADTKLTEAQRLGLQTIRDKHRPNFEALGRTMYPKANWSAPGFGSLVAITLSRLERDGLISKGGYPSYIITDAGRAALEAADG